MKLLNCDKNDLVFYFSFFFTLPTFLENCLSRTTYDNYYLFSFNNVLNNYVSVMCLCY